jgi:CubicO group peptidase (beta-lactamase class C family)
VVGGMRTIRAPGERLVYANGGFALLGYLAARLSKSPFGDVVRDRVFAPLGMQASAFPVSETGPRVSVPYGKALGGGGGRKPAPVGTNLTGPAGALVTSARDLARFGRMVLRGGELDGTRIVSEPLLAEATRRHATNHPGLSDGWGLGFQVSDYRARRMVGHSGDLPGVSTTIMVLPDDGIGVVVLTNGGDAAFTQRLRERVLEQMLGLEPEAMPGSPAGVLPPCAAEWHAFTRRVVGRYRFLDLVPPGPLAFTVARFLRPRVEHVSDDVLAVGGLGADVAMLYPDGEPGHYRLAHPVANGSRAVIEERNDGAHFWGFIMHARKPK